MIIIYISQRPRSVVQCTTQVGMINTFIPLDTTHSAPHNATGIIALAESRAGGRQKQKTGGGEKHFFYARAVLNLC